MKCHTSRLAMKAGQRHASLQFTRTLRINECQNYESTHPLRHLVYVALLAMLGTPHAVLAQEQATPPIDGVIGKLQSFDGKSLDVATSSGVVHVVVKGHLTTLESQPVQELFLMLRVAKAGPETGASRTSNERGVMTYTTHLYLIT